MTRAISGRALLDFRLLPTVLVSARLRRAATGEFRRRSDRRRWSNWSSARTYRIAKRRRCGAWVIARSRGHAADRIDFDDRRAGKGFYSCQSKYPM